MALDTAPAEAAQKVPQPVAPVAAPAETVLALPWGHHFALIEKVKEPGHRACYAEAAVREGWSRNVLTTMIKSQAHARQGGSITNFSERLPATQSDLAQQTLKDPYIFDFLSRSMLPFESESWRLTCSPTSSETALPTIDAIEAELSGEDPEETQ